MLQRPDGAAQQLFLLFHGHGGQPADMRDLGLRLAQAFPRAAVVSVPAAFEGDLGRGRQWYSLQGIDDANRALRVQEALPLFLAEVRRWQADLAVPPAATAVIGFSQGGNMALAASQLPELLAARVLGLAGRFTALPAQLPEQCTLHLVHGKHDEVVPYALTVQAAEHLVRLGVDVTADVLPFVGHELCAEVSDVVLQRLQSYIPQARWREALAAEAARQPGQGQA